MASTVGRSFFFFFTFFFFLLILCSPCTTLSGKKGKVDQASTLQNCTVWENLKAKLCVDENFSQHTPKCAARENLKSSFLNLFASNDIVSSHSTLGEIFVSHLYFLFDHFGLSWCKSPIKFNPTFKYIWSIQKNLFRRTFKKFRQFSAIKYFTVTVFWVDFYSAQLY